MAGGKAWTAPLTAIVAERSAELADHVADGQAGAVLGLAGDGQGGEHDGQVRFDRIAGAVEHRPGLKIGLGHPKRALDVPEVVVLRDHLCGGHDLDIEIGDVALQAHQ